MRAVILAGGRGTRLAPYTTVVPKPLLPVDDTPILEIILRQLAQHGFDHVTLALGHLSEYIRAFISHRRSLSSLMKIDFLDEETPTGTAGSLSAIEGLDSSFLVMNGDLLTTINYSELMNFHRAQGSILTVSVHQKPVKIDLGVLAVDSGLITNYIEKPTLHYTVSMGIYVYEPAALSYIPKGQYLDFPDLVLMLIKAKKKVAAYPNNAYWLDLGRHDDFQTATEFFTANKSLFLSPREPV